MVRIIDASTEQSIDERRPLVGVAVGDDPDALVDEVGEQVTSTSLSRAPLRGTGRYVLVWITSVVPVDDGIRAEVGEVRVLVQDADAETVGA